jgi:hypothetical protein
VPVSTSARTFRSAASCAIAARSASNVVRRSAFIVSGRRIAIRPTWPSMLTSISRWLMLPSRSSFPPRSRRWERGERRPSGPSLKLLSLIETKAFEAVV